MRNIDKGKELRRKVVEEKGANQKQKKDFKIEIVKVGKLEDKTSGNGCECGFSCECKCISDRNIKENFTQVKNHDILARLLDVSVETWNYKNQSPNIRHIGPMAQDFAAAFGVGEDDRHINMIDAFGVTLASIQALYEKIEQKDDKIKALEKRIDELKGLIS